MNFNSRFTMNLLILRNFVIYKLLLVHRIRMLEAQFFKVGKFSSFYENQN